MNVSTRLYISLGKITNSSFPKSFRLKSKMAKTPKRGGLSLVYPPPCIRWLHLIDLRDKDASAKYLHDCKKSYTLLVSGNYFCFHHSHRIQKVCRHQLHQSTSERCIFYSNQYFEVVDNLCETCYFLYWEKIALQVTQTLKLYTLWKPKLEELWHDVRHFLFLFAFLFACMFVCFFDWCFRATTKLPPNTRNPKMLTRGGRKTKSHDELKYEKKTELTVTVYSNIYFRLRWGESVIRHAFVHSAVVHIDIQDV